MSFHPPQASSTFRHLGLLLAAGALTGLFAGAAACSSDSSDDSAAGGSSASGSGSGGTSSSSGGDNNNDAGKASNSGGTTSNNGGTTAGGNAAAGGEPDNGGGTASGGTSHGGTSSAAGSSSGGSSTLPGDDNWACIQAGTSCICQNNSNPKDASVCTGTYKCCFAVPLGASTRCQCQDPYTSKCEDLAHALSSDGRVVDHCPP
ncbi:MAG TPA: hypothetical protein VHB79_38935 [Polyangiaceae bacterium]|nr:hypothetical protein [Polyangiaceae bacterium]